MMVGPSATGKTEAWRVLLAALGGLEGFIGNVRGKDAKQHWIIFDGDVDPKWVENLNSVLDNNKLLTLPSRERLNLPDNVQIMFKVKSLK
ncbi:hypothetical protein PPACK8108_LOCUS8608 [Phakopsora pachyrhizi]|uniref:Uncharacterized protein n=1 Tax=Phakopsora pachyrhizi TaxID=170000 RepID=A0AAV0AWK9_PHAPC|nr:hypothetical protein PPACK8108_LOCUS8608 [Phakopsora pachyrhizi]